MWQFNLLPRLDKISSWKASSVCSPVSESLLMVGKVKALTARIMLGTQEVATHVINCLAYTFAFLLLLVIIMLCVASQVISMLGHAEQILDALLRIHVSSQQ